MRCSSLSFCTVTYHVSAWPIQYSYEQLKVSYHQYFTKVKGFCLVGILRQYSSIVDYTKSMTWHVLGAL